MRRQSTPPVRPALALVTSRSAPTVPAAPAPDSPRGVYEERYPRHGYRAFYAVSSARERVAYYECRASTTDDLSALMGILWAELDRFDPLPVMGPRLLS